MYPKNCPKLSKDGKLTVKKDVHLIVSSSSFSRPLYPFSCQLGNLFLSKYITCNSVWHSRNIFEIPKFISTFLRRVVCIFKHGATL